MPHHTEPHDGRPESAPELDERQQEQAKEEESLSADVTHEVIRNQGEHELGRTASALAWSGLAAGLSMGFSLVAQGLLHHHLPDAEWRPLVASAGYAVGFVIVILASQQLFTENTLTVIVPLLTRRTAEVFGRVARLWGIVLLANLLGALLFAWVAGATELFSAEVRDSFGEVSREAMQGAFGTKLLQGIFAGWLIALMVWMLPAAQASRVAVIVLITYLVALAKLTHVVAGAVEAFYLVVTGASSWGAALGGYILPALLGNVIGGTMLVAALNHAQVVAGGGRD